MRFHCQFIGECFVCGHLCTTTAERSSCDSRCLACKAEGADSRPVLPPFTGLNLRVWPPGPPCGPCHTATQG